MRRYEVEVGRRISFVLLEERIIMNEFDYIRKIKQPTYRQSSLIKGVGDDAAVIRGGTYDMVTAVDTFVENIHFSSKTMPSYYIGYRLLAANISDMAAMGAIPKFYLVSIIIPGNMKQEKLMDIHKGMDTLAKQYNMDLIGGDTVSGEELSLSITIIGHVNPNEVRYRSDAKPNDIVFVTGTLGDAALGLHLLQLNKKIKHSKYFIRKHQQPTPRIEFARKASKINRIALNDVSDGIANELQEISDASNVDIIIDDDTIPISDELKEVRTTKENEWKYFGGEDFELVGTVAESDFAILQSIGEGLDIQVTKIGKVLFKQAKKPQVFVRKQNTISRLENRGYTHLSRSIEDEI